MLCIRFSSALISLPDSNHQHSWQQSSGSWQQSHHSWQQSPQVPGSNLISIPGSNLWLRRDAFTPGCHQILSSHGPLFTMLQNMPSPSPSCSLQLCVQNPTSS
ncbi:unnamed protein product [Staurois parvus]|uniref:Uncharacterized protein n=1 Tax=Staurois parvus TaxID=386267 RepID=A0ABN9EL43_9NEOB|nr:unnamed protein product [Staurois parvus]